MCPPGQGMSGRVYQIDAGWMGGAASIGYGQLSFLACRVRGYWSRQTLVLRPRGRVQCFFENVDPMRPMTHFPAQLEAVSRQKREPTHRRMAQSTPQSGHNLKMLPGGIHYGDIQQ